MTAKLMGREDWSRHIETAAREGKTLATYAREQGLQAQELYAYKKRLRRRTAELERSQVVIEEAKKQAVKSNAFVEVNLDRTNEDVLETFARAALATPEIVECNMIAGGFDYLLKIRVEDMTAYRKFMGTRLAELPGIRATHTFMVMENVKNSPAFPVDLPVRPEPRQRKPK